MKRRHVSPATGSRGSSASATNADIAGTFRELADLLELAGANPFRVRAYRNGARAVEDHATPLAPLAHAHPERLLELPSIGEDLAAKIVEIVTTGSLRALRQATREAPRGGLVLLRVSGLGPKRVRVLTDVLGVHTLKALRTAAARGKIRVLPGFGRRLEAKLLREIDWLEHETRRTLRPVAREHADALLAHLRALPGVLRAEVAGSYRRCKETVGDLDILVASDEGARVVEHFIAYGAVRDVLARGGTRASVRLRSGLQVDLRVLAARHFGAALHYFTGSKSHNITVRGLARRRGLKLNEYGLFRDGRWLGGSTESEVFSAVGLPFIPPELRENRGEIEAAASGRLPRLVTLAKIRGDLHAHTTDSDGRDSLEAMARAAEALGYEYLAITDHTPAIAVARGMDRRGFVRQLRRIERLNARLKSLTILSGAEVDVMRDGSLDLDDATLAELDVVVVSLHSHLELSPRDQNRRVQRALSHRSVDVFAHPTGRLIGRRRPAQFDLGATLRTAKDHGVMIEVNAQPERLDLDDVACRSAVEAGVRIVVSSDAHAVAELGFMRWGVEQARRGWAETQNVANTLPLSRFRRLLHRSR